LKEQFMRTSLSLLILAATVAAAVPVMAAAVGYFASLPLAARNPPAITIR